MKTIQVYDPPMCCSTGVCGPDVDPALPQFAGFLAKLENAGVRVERHNLTQNPLAFVQNQTVRAILEKDGVEAFPILFVDTELRLRGDYPDSDTREQWLAEANTISSS